MSDYSQRLRRAIPGGAHTYSRGDDQFSLNAPPILERGQGAYIFDPDGNRYLDYGMALRAVTIGYAQEEIVAAAVEQINFGNNLTRPSVVELNAAELLIDLIDSAEMVKFTKNGSTAVTAAVKLARAYTGRNLVVRCSDHPFFSYDDWFIGSTPLTKGVPREVIAHTKQFKYNDFSSLQRVVDEFSGEIACLVMEPATTEEPRDDFLKKIRDLCTKEGIVLIFDEMITGFRWHLKGAQAFYGVKPDLCTFGKAMANGFSVACVTGRRDLMSLGSIEPEGRERVFLLSTTHGAEMCGLGAFIATVEFLKRHSVVDHIWDYGKKLIAMMEETAEEYEVGRSFKVGGFACSPYFLTLDQSGNISLPLRTLFLQEMVKNGVLMPWISICYSHGEEELVETESALKKTFEVYRKALKDGPEKFIKGPVIKPVFRKYN